LPKPPVGRSVSVYTCQLEGADYFLPGSGGTDYAKGLKHNSSGSWLHDEFATKTEAE